MTTTLDDNHRRRALLAGAAAAAGLPGLARAQAGWLPSREVRLLNGFAAGGSADIVCRILSEALRPVLGHSVIVETRAGANGFIAAEAVARAAPDGHAVGLATMSMLTIAPQLPGIKLPINVETELTPLANIAGIYKLLVADPNAPFRTVPELIAYAKANAGVISYASAGIGSSPHLAAELFRRQAGIEIVHVPYRGGALAIIDLAAGRVQMLIGNMTDFLGQVKTGKLRGIAFGGDRAAPVLPDLPLIKQWLPNFSVSNWFGIVGPRRLPAPIVAAWNAALQKVMADPAVQARMVDNGVEILAGPVERFNAEIAAYRANWGEVIRAAGIRAE